MSIIEQLDLEKRYKVDVIYDINRMLMRAGQDQLSADDFTTLYDLDTDSLHDAKLNIREQLRTIRPKLKRSKGSHNQS